MSVSSFVWGYLAIAGIAAIVIYVRSSRDPLIRIAKYSENYSESAEIIGGLLAALVWPVGIIFGVNGALKRVGDSLRSRREKHRLQLFKQKIEKAVEESAGDLDQEERRALVGYLVEVAETPVEESPAGPFDRLPAEYVANRIDRLWQSHDTEEVEIRGVRPSDAPPGEVQKPDSIRFSIAVPAAARDDWGFHMTNDFRKSVKNLDKSMRGRVLDAITEICKSPMEVRGDTVKPLTGELSGCWRYRLGDYRLIYQPIKEVRRIDLITIGGRGGAYVH